jgi:hypothetical protein
MRHRSHRTWGELHLVEGVKDGKPKISRQAVHGWVGP